MALLRRAIAIGYRNPRPFRNEPALEPLRDRDDFRLLLLDLSFPADPLRRRLSVRMRGNTIARNPSPDHRVPSRLQAGRTETSRNSFDGDRPCGVAGGNPRPAAPRCGERAGQAATGLRNRRTTPTPIKPKVRSNRAPGSGTAALSETPASTAMGGRPDGVPRDRKESISLLPLAVKDIVTGVQPMNPSLALLTRG